MAPTPTLTEREKELLVCIFQCLKTPPEVDLDKLAAISGYKTRASANTAFHKLKGKIGKAETDADADGADAGEDAEADAEDTPVAPSATKKARGKKAAVIKAEEPQTDEDEESETIAVKAKPKSARAALSRKAAAQPASVRRSTRNSLKASKPSIKDESSGDSEEEVVKKRPITLKRGKIVYPTEEEIRNVTSVINAAAEAPAATPEDAAANTNTLKRAATEPGSDFDELANDTKRVKVIPTVKPAGAVVEPIATTTTSVVSVDPIVETYVVNDPETVYPSADITMAVDDVSSDVDAEGDTDAASSDVPSNVASAATSGDHDDI